MKPYRVLGLAVACLVVFNGATFGQVNRLRNLTVNGQSGQADVIQQDGRFFADLAALAAIGKGSLSFNGSAIVVILPARASGSSAAVKNPAPIGTSMEPAVVPEAKSKNDLSQEFMKAGIEEIARLREWATTLAGAIRGNYGVTDEWVNGYRDQALQSQELAEAAATTDGDRKAAQELRRAVDLVQQWSDKMVAAKKSMDTAKYTMSPNALRADPLSQKLIACGHFLTQMLGSASFKDDAACD